jgi:hypothetical protein
MLKVKIDVKKYGYAEFKCPSCFQTDVAYMRMPTLCWSCGDKYIFDFPSLLLYQKERIHFHFNRGKTSDNHD